MCFLMRADHALVRIRDLLKERLLAVIEKYGVYTDKVEKDQGTSYRV